MFTIEVAMILLAFSFAVMNLLSANVDFFAVPRITVSAPFGKVFE